MAYPVGKESTGSAGDTGDMDLIPGLGISPGGEKSNTLQYSCLENPMDRRAWWATDHGVSKSRIRLSNFIHTQIQRCLFSKTKAFNKLQSALQESG